MRKTIQQRIGCRYEVLRACAIGGNPRIPAKRHYDRTAATNDVALVIKRPVLDRSGQRRGRYFVHNRKIRCRDDRYSSGRQHARRYRQTDDFISSYRIAGHRWQRDRQHRVARANHSVVITTGHIGLRRCNDISYIIIAADMRKTIQKRIGCRYEVLGARAISGNPDVIAHCQDHRSATRTYVVFSSRRDSSGRRNGRNNVRNRDVRRRGYSRCLHLDHRSRHRHRDHFVSADPIGGDRGQRDRQLRSTRALYRVVVGPGCVCLQRGNNISNIVATREVCQPAYQCVCSSYQVVVRIRAIGTVSGDPGVARNGKNQRTTTCRYCILRGSSDCTTRRYGRYVV